MTTGELVEEVPGFYGAVKMEESILQKIWVEQDFLSDSLKTDRGQKIFVDFAGDWNISEEGPDFRNARLIIDGDLRVGDVEVHFEQQDWIRHGHHTDSNYNNVILQVCLFANSSRKKMDSQKENTKLIPTLFLVPHLMRGIEEYAEAYAMEKLSGRDSLMERDVERLRNLSNEEIKDLAVQRWSAKLRFAEARLQKQSWEMACHQWFLEILGYRRNKCPMARIAQRYEVSKWKNGEINTEDIFQTEKGWRLRGCRPANHPRTRLRQYLDLWRIRPNWIEDVMRLMRDDLFDENRRLSKTVKVWNEEVLGKVFANGKANTLLIDGVWPLLCSFSNMEGFEVWNSWPAGDCPEKFRKWARELGWTDQSARKHFSNGMVQAMLESMNNGDRPQVSE